MNPISSKISRRNTSKKAVLSKGITRPDGVDTSWVFIFTEEGPFPFRTSGHEMAQSIQNEALDRPVPVEIRDNSEVHYAAERDDFQLHGQSFHAGTRVQWDGSAYDPSADNSGCINLVQPTSTGLQLSNLNPTAQGIGRNGYRAHGNAWFNRYTSLMMELAEARQLDQELAQQQASAEDDDEEADLEAVAAIADALGLEDSEQALDIDRLRAIAQSNISSLQSDLEEYLMFIDLTYGDDILVNYETEVFTVAGEGNRAERVAHLEKMCLDHLGLTPGDWKAAAEGVEAETEGARA